jgi:ankyrin repeat protein
MDTNFAHHQNINHMDIFEASRTNNIEALKTALENTDVNARDGRGSTPLIVATYYNNIDAVKALLEAGADTGLQDGMGNTALMGICFKGYTEAGKLLIEHGADITAVNGNNASALTFAATFGHNELIKLLLAKGANPLLKDNFGKNPIDYAQVQENEEGYKVMGAAIKK